MPDSEVYDVFARLNTFAVILNAQELRNAQWFGEFKTSVYDLSREFITFWQSNQIFNNERILRMAEAEFVSELLIAMSVGIRARSKQFIDNFYKENDDRFPNRSALEKKFRETMDIIGGIFGDFLRESKFRETRLLYPLFCAIYHLNHQLPELTCKRLSIKPTDYSKLNVALNSIDMIFEKLDEATDWQERIDAGESEDDLLAEERQKRIDAGELEEDVNEELEQRSKQIRERTFDPLNPDERNFYDAYSVHWVHADRRAFITEYICALLINALE